MNFSFVRFFLPTYLCLGISTVASRSSIFTQYLKHHTLNETAFKNITVDNEARCFGICIHEKKCNSFDHDKLSGNSYINCRFYETNYGHPSMTAVQESPNVILFGRTRKDCIEWYSLGYRENGIYEITLNDRPLFVYCRMDIDGGGWIVFQRRFDGSVGFNNNWEDFKWGFGNKAGEHWLGNEYVHQLSTSFQHQLYIQASAADNEVNACKYDHFHVESENQYYRLWFSEEQPLSGGVTNVGLQSTTHNGANFGTKDRDNDKNPGNCAILYNSGWWFNSCFAINLNGIYRTPGPSGRAEGIHWHTYWKGHYESLKSTMMMMRRKL